MKASFVQVGIDVAKADLEVATATQNVRYANTPAGHRRLLVWLQSLGSIRVVLEATGGYERELVQALHAPGKSWSAWSTRARCAILPRAQGRLAKTDENRVLGVLVDFASALAPQAHAGAQPQQRRLSELVQTTFQLVASRAIQPKPA